MYTKCKWLLLLVLVCLFSNIAVAQSDPEIIIHSVELDFSSEFEVCGLVDLEVNGLEGQTIVVVARPYFTWVDEEFADVIDVSEDRYHFIPNMTGDPTYTDDDGYIMDYHEELMPFDSVYWPDGFEVCVDYAHLPSDLGLFQFSLLIDAFLPNSDIGATYDTYQDKEGGIVEFFIEPPFLRLSHIHADFDAVVDNESGLAIKLALQTVGFEGRELRVAVFLIDENGVPLSASSSAGDYSAEYFLDNGVKVPALTSQDVVGIPFYNSVWTPQVEGSDYFSLFIPAYAMTAGSALWSPQFIIWDEGSGEELYNRTFWREIFEVTVYPA